MRKAAIVVIIILLQIALYADIGSTAEKTRKKNQKHTYSPKKATIYLNVPFDVGIEKIPVPFSGHDIEQVYKAFDRRKKAEQKDEFETTEQYQRRLSKQVAESLFGSVGQDSGLAFVVSPIAQYDADSQILTITIETSPVWEMVKIDESRMGVRIKKGESFKEKEIRQNAYGARVNVEVTYVKSFNLAIHNQQIFETEKVFSESERKYQKEREKRLSDLNRRLEEMGAKELSSRSDDWGGKIVFVKRINMDFAEAKAAKDKVAAVILVKPTTPYISDGAILRNATFDNPTEYFHQLYYVDVNLLEIWIYDKRTGKIISKIKGKL